MSLFHAQTLLVHILQDGVDIGWLTGVVQQLCEIGSMNEGSKFADITEDQRIQLWVIHCDKYRYMSGVLFRDRSSILVIWTVLSQHQKSY